MSKNYQKGRSFEYSVKDVFERAGFYVIRSSGSHTDFDLICLAQNKVYLVQCKFNLEHKRAQKIFQSLFNSVSQYVKDLIEEKIVRICLAYSYNRKRYLLLNPDQVILLQIAELRKLIDE
ncbi:MAG: restriction endonuclease [bacterium]